RGESDDGEEDDAEDKDGDERDDDDDEQEIAKINEQDDTERGGDDDEESESDEESDEEETREEESFDPIPRTSEDSEDDGNDEEDQGLKDGDEERLNEEEEANKLYRDRIIKEQVKSQVEEQVSRILPRIEQYVNAQLEAKVLTRSSHSSRTSYAVAADLSEMELKKILIKKIEGNKEDVMMMMIRKKDPSLDQTGGLRDGDKVSASESAFAEEPVQTISQMDEPSYPVFKTSADDQPIVQSSQHS
nr:hypothetical protein [Tanacetum cinerariifolium]